MSKKILLKKTPRKSSSSKVVRNLNWYIDNPEGNAMVLRRKITYPIINDGYAAAPQIPKPIYAIDIFTRAIIRKQYDFASEMLEQYIIASDMNAINSCCTALGVAELIEVEDILDICESVIGNEDDGWEEILDPNDVAYLCFDKLMRCKHFDASLRIQNIAANLLNYTDINRPSDGEGNILVSLIKYSPASLTYRKFQFLMRHGLTLDVPQTNLIRPRSTLREQLTFGINLEVYIEILKYVSRNSS